MILTPPTQLFEVGKRALEHGVTSSMQYYARKYPKYRLTETSVRRWKNQYHSTFKKPKQSSNKATEDASDTAEDLDDTAEGSTKQIQELP